MTHLDKQQGFTLIELLITTAIGLVIMAGMTSVFVSQTRTATMLKNKTEAMGDLFLASQIMQSELRGAKRICWNGTNILSYQPIDSNTSCVAGVNAANGSFEIRPVNATHPTPYICWARPNNRSGCQELLRGLPVAGALTVAMIAPAPVVPPLPITYVIDLQSNFTGQANQAKTLGLTFKVWARN
ncbi:MAG: prepilin-type N-terminal cleavage/methylation domain-containing protein [Mariprofundaceae bacterium]|nr:prepilin-type N-terminal cleavage/methylation domain-containing protein [Mariprofundaceae bacterium]